MNVEMFQAIHKATKQEEPAIDPFALFRSLAEVASQTKADVDFDRAEDCLHQIGPIDQTWQALALLAGAHAKAGNIDTARFIASNKIESPYWCAEAHLEIYRVTGDKQDLIAVQDLISSVASPENRKELLAQIREATRSS